MTVLRRRFRKCSKGAAAAEMALMLPIMILLLLGTFEGGHFLWSEHKVIKGVRDGARYAGRFRFELFDCTNTTIDNTVETNIKKLTRTGYPTGDNPTVAGTDNPVVPGWDDSEVTVTLTCDSTTNTGIYQDVSGGAPIVEVSASVPYTSLFGMLGFDTSNIKLNASAQSAVMGV